MMLSERLKDSENCGKGDKERERGCREDAGRVDRAVRPKRTFARPFADHLENELHVIYSLRLRDILDDILVGHVDRPRVGIDRRPLEATSKNDSGTELRDPVARSVDHQTVDGSRSESIRQSRNLLHYGISPIRGSLLRRGRFGSRSHAGAQTHRQVSGSRRQTLRRRLQRWGESQNQQYATGVRGRQVRACINQRQRDTNEGGHSSRHGPSHDGKGGFGSSDAVYLRSRGFRRRLREDILRNGPISNVSRRGSAQDKLPHRHVGSSKEVHSGRSGRSQGLRHLPSRGLFLRQVVDGSRLAHYRLLATGLTEQRSLRGHFLPGETPTMGQVASRDATYHHRLRAVKRVPSFGRFRIMGRRCLVRLGFARFLPGPHTFVVYVRLDAPVRRAKRSATLQQTRICVRLVVKRDHETLSFSSGCFGSSYTVALARLQAQMGRRRGGG